MSRLDSFIRRMSAQRDILNSLSDRLDSIPGPIFEFGLGSGRTYDHLRERFPNRQIVVFERVEGDCHRMNVVPADLVTGDLQETTSQFPDGYAAMIHADIDTGHASNDAPLSSWLPTLVARLLKPGGFAASSIALIEPRLAALPVPPGLESSRYHLVRRIETTNHDGRDDDGRSGGATPPQDSKAACSAEAKRGGPSFVEAAQRVRRAT